MTMRGMMPRETRKNLNKRPSWVYHQTVSNQNHATRSHINPKGRALENLHIAPGEKCAPHSPTAYPEHLIICTLKHHKPCLPSLRGH